MDTVSVIIPIYNVAPYLKKCVDSCRNQTYSQLQIILVDDGSTDESGILCDQFAEEDSRIVVIHQENKGLSGARNAGLKLAKGNYVYFLDGDDYIKDTLVEVCVSQMQPDIDWLFFDYAKVSPNGNLIERFQSESGEYVFASQEDGLRFMMLELLNYKRGWEAWNHMYRRSIIEEYQIDFADNKRIFAEDKYFNVCYGLFARKVRCIDEVLYYYVQREDSIIGRERKNNHINQMNECSFLVREYISNQINRQNDLHVFEKNYPVIHWAIMQLELYHYNEEARTANKKRQREIRNEALTWIQNKKFFIYNMRSVPGCYKILADLYGYGGAIPRVLQGNFWGSGSSLLYYIGPLYEKIHIVRKKLFKKPGE